MSPLDFFGRRFRNATNEKLNDSSSENFATEIGEWCEEGPAATLVTSATGDSGDIHAPVLDIDLPCHWEPSTRPGHGHLYINRLMPWSNVVKLLDVLVEVGIVEPGFRDASVKRGYTSVRTPWTKKPGVAE